MKHALSPCKPSTSSGKRAWQQVLDLVTQSYNEEENEVDQDYMCSSSESDIDLTIKKIMTGRKKFK